MAKRTMMEMGVALLALLVAGTGSAAAQEGGVTGVVTDDTGGVLPGVTVEASGAPLPGGPRLTVTDGDGTYALTALPPGTFLVTFTLPGFERLERELALDAAATATLDVSLELGGLFEEVTVAVTGTAIEAPAINMPHAVAVVSRETLEQQGSTQLVDLFRNLSVSHGVVGERNSWYNSNQPATLTENVANVNLRGLGASRTLVLINGRRHVPVPARLIGGRFVDINTIPAIAIGRLEVLKEGASATYGSDAVGGVANFVTRSDFRGFELNVSHDYFADGGDTTVAGIWGGRIGASSAVFSAERVGRQELQIADRPWALNRLSAYPPGTRGGWSSIGNPGTF
ncbi:MAG: TonB-dependent receptor, partial [Acidobacteria bacterium]|nr:TonB-dependent receptor [Acidobacteriota bacterium]